MFNPWQEILLSHGLFPLDKKHIEVLDYLVYQCRELLGCTIPEATTWHRNHAYIMPMYNRNEATPF